jgi:RNA polymerase sigma factor (TIGR02999 family)
MTAGQGQHGATSSSGEATRLLLELAEGRAGAADELLPMVYTHLRAIAEQRMELERPGHTLQATALVHEAYLRLVGAHDIAWNGRAHFYHIAAEAMRRLLVEHARARGRIKRGGDRQRAPLNILDLAADPDEEQIVALDDAMRRLEQVDGQAAEVVRLRFYAGLSVEQTSDALGISARTVKRDWAFARAWLHQALAGEV